MSFETYAEINLDNITHNITALKKHVGNAEVMAVLKANAYGLDAPSIFKHLCSIGVKRFAVANFREAMELRQIDSQVPILIFGNINPENMETAINNNLTITVFSKEFWEILKQKIDKNVNVHIKLNTGFNRLGFECDDESVKIIKEIANNPFVNTEGVYSHLALGSEENDKAQFDLFTDMVSRLENEGIKFKFKHIADSISAVTYKWSHLDMVRLGAVMYGLKANYPGYDELGLKGTVRLYSSVSQVRKIKKGAGISYDYLFCAPEDMTVATVAFGYADGYPRNLGRENGFVLIHGQKATILGIMCMDQCVVDVTHISDVRVNDEVLLYETEDKSPVSVASVALLAGTNKNGLLSGITKRVAKVYIKNYERLSSEQL